MRTIVLFAGRSTPVIRAMAHVLTVERQALAVGTAGRLAVVVVRSYGSRGDNWCRVTKRAVLTVVALLTVASTLEARTMAGATLGAAEGLRAIGAGPVFEAKALAIVTDTIVVAVVGARAELAMQTRPATLASTAGSPFVTSTAILSLTTLNAGLDFTGFSLPAGAASAVSALVHKRHDTFTVIIARATVFAVVRRAVNAKETIITHTDTFGFAETMTTAVVGAGDPLRSDLLVLLLINTDSRKFFTCNALPLRFAGTLASLGLLVVGTSSAVVTVVRAFNRRAVVTNESFITTALASGEVTGTVFVAVLGAHFKLD